MIKSDLKNAVSLYKQGFTYSYIKQKYGIESDIMREAIIDANAQNGNYNRFVMEQFGKVRDQLRLGCGLEPLDR